MVDIGFMSLKPHEEARGLANYKHNALKPGQPAVEVVPTFEPSDPVIIEWRAMTVATLDRVAIEVRKQLGLPNLTLAQVLQGGTWNVSYFFTGGDHFFMTWRKEARFDGFECSLF